MLFYLSSFKIGNSEAVQQLKSLLPINKKTAYIANALYFAKPESRQKHIDWDMRELREVGLEPEEINLQDYFGKEDLLREKMKEFGVIYVSGGNVYDLRMGMKLSGFDVILKEKLDEDVLYAGYSAAVCVLSPTLKGYHIVDDPNLKTYGDHKTIWEGLDFISWQFAPHYDSDHDESEDINKEIAYYIEHDLPYKALRDGEVIVLTREELDGGGI